MKLFFDLQMFTQIPSDALYYGSHYYKIFNEGLDWQQAKVRCEEMGGHLVTITSKKEQSFIDNMIKDGTRGCYWSGGYKVSDNWNWVTGENFSYTNWGYGEPNNTNDGDENYIMIFQCQPPNAQSQSGEWNDSQNSPFADGFYGTDNFGFICEWGDYWTISGTTATYGTSSETLVTVKGVKSLDGLSLSGKVVTVANSSLNNSKVTISNGYTLKLADNVSSSSTKKAGWSYRNSTATYKSASKTAGYSLASDGKSITYSKATSASTLAKITGAKSKSGLSLSGKKIALTNSALSKKVTVKGSYEFDFAAGYKNATISGTDKADTITARGTNLKIFGGAGKDSIKMVGTNQTISGGAGADVFIYAASGGNEKITDFQSIDKLKIGADGDGNYSTVTSGDDLIVSTDDGGKITLVGAANLSDIDIVGTKKTSGKGVKVSGNGKKITLTENFEDSSFSLSGKYSSAVTLDASEVLLDLSITGNNFSNRIIGTAQDDTIDGGAGNDTIFGGDGSDSIFGGKGDDIIFGGIGKDTLWGGAGDDELYGNDGKDVFYYNTGEGNDTIFGYEASVDKIILASGTVSNVTTDRNNNVIFSVGDGQIVVNNCADRTVKIVNSSGNIVKNGLYEP